MIIRPLFSSLMLLLVLVTLLSSGCGSGDSGSFEEASPQANGAQGSFKVDVTIQAADHTYTDSDTNMALSYFQQSNNTPEEAQPVDAPAIIGGYVTLPLHGHEGAVYETGDVNDFYQVQLNPGQTITLAAANCSSNLDLYLYPFDAINPIASATSEMGTEQLTVPGDAPFGSYYVEVRILSGASKYQLHIGSAPAQVSSCIENPNTSVSNLYSAPFVAGEIVVQYQSDRPYSAFSAETGLLEKAASSQSIKLLSLTQDNLVSVKSALNITNNSNQPTDLATETLRVVEALNQRADVKFAEPNYIRQPYLTPNDPLYTYQWNYQQLNLPAAWDFTTGSNQVIVAVIDTGIYLNHPDLSGAAKLTPGYDFITLPAIAGDGDGPDPDPNDPGDRSGINSHSSFHGTHVAGIIAAKSNNNIGVSGVAWGAKIMPLRALGRGGGTSFDIAQAILYAAGLDNATAALPAQKADVINMSLGSVFSADVERLAIERARDKGLIIVAAAGNNATAEPHYPASYEGVFSVSATDIQGNLALYSSFGETVDIAAPGGQCFTDLNNDGLYDCVLSTWVDDSSSPSVPRYQGLQGTSMATPHVAGVFALMKSLNPSLTGQDIRSLLLGGELTTDRGASGRDDKFGYGLIDARKAVIAARREGNSDSPELIVSPSHLNFDNQRSSLSVLVLNGGGGHLTLQDPVSNYSWIRLSQDTSDTNKYHITLDRSGLEYGYHKGFVTFKSELGGDRTVTIEMQKTEFTTPTSGGTQFVALVDANAEKLEGHLKIVEPITGLYQLRFDNIPSGDYKLIVGNDLDNDGAFCGIFEACGAYNNVASPDIIRLNKNYRFELNTRYLDKPFPITYQTSSNTQRKSLPKQMDLDRLF